MPRRKLPPVSVSTSVASDDLASIYQNGQSVLVEYQDVPALITTLRRAYNAWKQEQEQSQADGVVASVLLQSAAADAPGDFS